MVGDARRLSFVQTDQLNHLEPPSRITGDHHQCHPPLEDDRRRNPRSYVACLSVLGSPELSSLPPLGPLPRLAARSLARSSLTPRAGGFVILAERTWSRVATRPSLTRTEIVCDCVPATRERRFYSPSLPSVTPDLARSRHDRQRRRATDSLYGGYGVRRCQGLRDAQPEKRHRGRTFQPQRRAAALVAVWLWNRRSSSGRAASAAAALRVLSLLELGPAPVRAIPGHRHARGADGPSPEMALMLIITRRVRSQARAVRTSF